MTNKFKILFVDDDQNILDGLKRMLYGQRHEWQTSFALGGEEALKKLEQQNFDVIVSDMRMPGMDGAQLLAKVKENFPDVVRIILSGHTALEASFRAVTVAHQFLNKPLDADNLKTIIQSVCKLHRSIDNQEMQKMIGQIHYLPVLKKTKNNLDKVLNSENPTLKEIANIIEQDIGYSTKVLQLVNSAFFGLPRRISNIHNAVSYLGIEVINHLNGEIEIVDQNSSGRTELSLKTLLENAHLTAKIASRMFDDKAQAEDAYMSGMLHSVGQIILTTHLPEKMQEAIELAKKQSIPLHQAETQIFSFNHAQIGSYLLGIWGLPKTIVESVANYLQPNKDKDTTFDIPAALYVATHLSHEFSTQKEKPFVQEKLDMDYINSIGMMSSLSTWKEIAQEQSTSLQEGGRL